MENNCGEKPRSPYPDESWFRTGTKNHRVIYQVDPDHPEGIMVGSMDTDELTKKALEGLNMYRVGEDGV